MSVHRRKLKNARVQMKNMQQIVTEVQMLLMQAGFQLDSVSQIPEAVKALVEELDANAAPASGSSQPLQIAETLSIPPGRTPEAIVLDDDEIVLGAPAAAAPAAPPSIVTPSVTLDPAALAAKMKAKLEKVEKTGIKRSVGGGGLGALAKMGQGVPTKALTPVEEQRRLLAQATGKPVKEPVPGRAKP